MKGWTGWLLVLVESVLLVLSWLAAMVMIMSWLLVIGAWQRQSDVIIELCRVLRQAIEESWRQR